MPLAVYADWLEEVGDERAEAVRWLADRGKQPILAGNRWFWRPFWRDTRGVSPTLRRVIGGPFVRFDESLRAAVFAVRETDVGSIDEFADTLQWFARNPRGVPEIGRDDVPVETPERWLISNRIHPRDVDHTGWTWTRSTEWVDGTIGTLPGPVFDRLLEGGRRTADDDFQHRVYLDAESAVRDVLAAARSAFRVGALDLGLRQDYSGPWM